MQDILIIDDDDGFREAARIILQDAGHHVYEASCAEDAFVRLLAGERYHLIFCDLHLPFANGPRRDRYRFTAEVGYRAAKELAGVLPDCKVIVLSSCPPKEVMRIVPRLYPIQAFSKPTSPRDLLGLIEETAIPQ